VVQFLQTDPIGTKDDPNLYMYVGLNPGNGTDPSGLTDVDYSTKYDHPNIQDAGTYFDLPGVTTMFAHGPPISAQTGDGQFAPIPTSDVVGALRRAGGAGEPILIGACRCGSNAITMGEISKQLGDRPLMASTSQTWWQVSRNRDGVVQSITMTAAWRDPETGEMDPNNPGEFRVVNGSAADFGVRLGSGESLAGFKVDLQHNRSYALVRSTPTGSHLTKVEQRNLRPVKKKKIE